MERETYSETVPAVRVEPTLKTALMRAVRAEGVDVADIVRRALRRELGLLPVNPEIRPIPEVTEAA